MVIQGREKRRRRPKQVVVIYSTPSPPVRPVGEGRRGGMGREKEGRHERKRGGNQSEVQIHG